MYTKILVPLDGSMVAEKALPYAVSLANRFNAKLLLMRAVEVPTLMVDSPEHEMELISNAEEYLTEVKATITNPKLANHIEPELLQTMVVYGNPVEQIAELAPFEKADLVLMTTHGRSGLSRLVMGSVAAHLVHKLTVPLMLVRPLEVKNDQLLIETMMGIGEPYCNCLDKVNPQIVLTLDGQSLSELAIEPALEFAKKLGGTLNLLSVVFPAPPMVYSDLVGLGYSQTDMDETNKKLVSEAETYLKELQAKIAAQGIETVIAVRSGAVADEITEYALKVNASALVMATHARGEMGHVFMGSVSEEVMRRTHLPVVMVSTKAKGEEVPNTHREVVSKA